MLWALALALAIPLAARAEPAREGIRPVEHAPAAEELALRERAGAYWEARVAASDRVFSFYPPREQGGPQGPHQVSEGGNLRFTRFAIQGVELRGDEGTVHVWVEAQVPSSGRAARPSGVRSTRLRELWDRLDGTWYKRPVPRGFGRQPQEERSQP